jgi:hypothetical protein
MGQDYTIRCDSNRRKIVTGMRLRDPRSSLAKCNTSGILTFPTEFIILLIVHYSLFIAHPAIPDLRSLEDFGDGSDLHIVHSSLLITH